MRELAAKLGLKTGHLFGSIRTAVSGSTATPPLFQMMEVLGRGVSMKRIEQAIERLRRGITLEDETRTAPAKIKRVYETQTNTWFEIILHEGKNQQIRRMFDLIGHSVMKLRRSQIGPLRDDKLKPGAWRKLSEQEVKAITTRGRNGREKRAASHASSRQ